MVKSVQTAKGDLNSVKLSLKFHLLFIGPFLLFSLYSYVQTMLVFVWERIELITIWYWCINRDAFWISKLIIQFMLSMTIVIGCLNLQVEYSYPPLLEGKAVDSNECPEKWRHLPSLALPDGAHNFVEGYWAAKIKIWTL